MPKHQTIEIFILGSRYVFLLMLALFLKSIYLGRCYETKKWYARLKGEVYLQRMIIGLMHVLAFFILTVSATEPVQNQNIIENGIYGLLFLIIGWIATSYMFRRSDRLLWNAIFFLMDVGFIMLYRLEPAAAQKQLVWFSVGMGLVLALPVLFRFFHQVEHWEKIYLIAGWILLFSPFLLGSERYGARNWIFIGNYGFQPSEIVKFLLVFYLASVFYKGVSYKQLFFPSVMTAGYILILVIQRDLGAALIYFITYLVMIYVATSQPLFFIGGLGAATIASMGAYRWFSHVQVRVEAWLNPWKDIDNKGYQITQSLFAIGTWGWLGSGLTRGYAKHVPAVTTDFIFASICEEFGNLFAIGIIAIFLFVILRGFMIAMRCREEFYSLLAVGVANMLGIQTFLIVGGVIKFIPLTGVTLPFISYGGSSAVVSILMIGLLQWIDHSNEKNQAEEGYFE